jgi:hypothetical protein
VSALERLAASVLLAVLLVLGAWFGVRHYGAEQRQAGWDAAVAAGQEERDAAALAALAIESGLRARLLEQDTENLRKEQKYAESLEAAQRRLRAGDDRLRCPAGPVPGAAPAGDRPAAAGPGADGEGLDVVPEVAADLLGLAADHQRLLRNYERVVERFETCRSVNSR